MSTTGSPSGSPASSSTGVFHPRSKYAAGKILRDSIISHPLAVSTSPCPSAACSTVPPSRSASSSPSEVPTAAASPSLSPSPSVRESAPASRTRLNAFAHSDLTSLPPSLSLFLAAHQLLSPDAIQPQLHRHHHRVASSSSTTTSSSASSHRKANPKFGSASVPSSSSSSSSSSGSSSHPTSPLLSSTSSPAIMTSSLTNCPLSHFDGMESVMTRERSEAVFDSYGAGGSKNAGVSCCSVCGIKFSLLHRRFQCAECELGMCGDCSNKKNEEGKLKSKERKCLRCVRSKEIGMSKDTMLMISKDVESWKVGDAQKLHA